jgi:hypothetical protein
MRVVCFPSRLRAPMIRTKVHSSVFLYIRMNPNPKEASESTEYREANATV